MAVRLTVNFNDYLYIKLTEAGENHLVKFYEDIEAQTPSFDTEEALDYRYMKDEWVRLQVNEFIEIFGNTILHEMIRENKFDLVNPFSV